MMKNTLRKIAVLVLFALVISSVTCMAKGQPEPVAQKGVLDLRNFDLSEKPIALNGEWGFFWKKMLAPDSLRAAGAPDYVPFPVIWKDITLHGQKLPSEGYATYTLTILLPKKRPRIGLEVPDVYCTYKLYVNGIVQVQNGQPGRTAAESVPFWNTRTIALPPGESDSLVLVLQVANFWHFKGGPYKQLLIGDKDLLFLKKNRDAAYDLALAGCMFMGGLFFLGLFVFGRHDKTTLYFSLFCVLYSYRMVGTDAYVLHSLFDHLDWFITIRIEYITLSLGAVLFCSYTKHLFPDDAHPLVMRTIIWFCLLYSGFNIVTPPVVFTSLLNGFLVMMFICIGYALYVNLRAARNKRSGSLYALLSTVTMLLILLLSNLHYFGLIPPLKLIQFIGYLAFFFLQSLALSHRFADTFKRATLQAQQGLKAKSEFLSTMSHEIRTPLNAVIGMTHLLLRNKPRQDQKEDLDVLLFSANNLLSIVNNILDYNKIEEGKISFEHIPMDLPAIARNIVAGLKSTAQEKRDRPADGVRRPSG